LLAESTDTSLEENRASGGVVTSLLQFGIREGYFSEILTVDYQKSSVCADPIWLRNDISEVAGSKYAASPLLTLYKRGGTDTAATVLPCQAAAVRNQNDKTFLFGLFCSKLSTTCLIDFMAARYKIDREDIEGVHWRKGKWPGRFCIVKKNGEQISSSISSIARSPFAAAMNSYLFCNEGCLFCNDYFCEHADISFGDPWGRTEYGIHHGQTIVVIRSERGRELVRAGIDAGMIRVKKLSAESLIREHIKGIYSKKTLAAWRIQKMNQVFGNKFSYAESALVQGKCKSSYNRFMEYNNRTIKGKWLYKQLHRIPLNILFFYHYFNVWRLNKFLKRNKIADKYIEAHRESSI
jgi:coenzyme F420-reducing hydrogenase beta subunit